MQLRSLWSAVLVVGTSLLSCASVHGILTNESTTPTLPSTAWSGVGALRISQVIDPSGDTYVPGSLTGTLIDSTHVLTAAHGVFDRETGTTFDPSLVTFSLGSQHLQAASIAIPSQYKASSRSYDLAVVTLTSPATGATSYAWNHGQIDPKGKRFMMVGYGQTGSINGVKASSNFGGKRSATNTIDVVTQGHNPMMIQDQVARHTSKRNTVRLPAGMLVFDFDHTDDDPGPTGNGTSSPTEGDGGNGDSGSPMFVKDASGQPVIVGLLLDGSDSKVRVGEVAWGANLLDQPYANFLAANLPSVSSGTAHPDFVAAAAPVPEPASACVLVLGAAALLRRPRNRAA